MIVPTQGSQLDASQAARALALIKNQEKQARRRIPHAVLLTRTNPAIRPRTLTNIMEQLRSHGIPVLQTQLNEREAFRAMFSFGGTLDTLDPTQVGGLEKAVVNARSYTAEVVELLRGGSELLIPATAREVA